VPGHGQLAHAPTGPCRAPASVVRGDAVGVRAMRTSRQLLGRSLSTRRRQLVATFRALSVSYRGRTSPVSLTPQSGPRARERSGSVLTATTAGSSWCQRGGQGGALTGVRDGSRRSPTVAVRG
jgi:hypothetical protein